MSDFDRELRRRIAARDGDSVVSESYARELERSGQSPSEARPHLVADIAAQIITWGDQTPSPALSVFQAKQLVDMSFSSTAEVEALVQKEFEARVNLRPQPNDSTVPNPEVLR